MNLWALMIYTSLLNCFLIAHASPEADPEAAAGKKRPAESSSVARGAEKEARPHFVKANKNFFEQYGSKCYHLQFDIKYVLNPENYPRLTPKSCSKVCKDSIKSMANKAQSLKQPSKKGCLESGFCIRSRAVNITERSCSDKQTAAAAQQACYLDTCACSATVNLWRIRRHGPANVDEYLAMQPGWQNRLQCHPDYMMNRYSTTQWQIGKWSIVDNDIDCKRPLNGEATCTCQEGDGLCGNIETFSSTRCALDNPGPGGGCLCAAERHEQCVPETGLTRPAADEVDDDPRFWDGLEDMFKLEDRL
ncbi:hypothetical protein BCR37DRAFT_377175 [Protomyces lactucae-debilis]|uniref:Extracellular membrane protein CFEM domain-containing protein n=1 Tax=Protomyces lactucae-debilis TaxID=2754530 RepID=A0A1Y2FNA9_PROLT|nr:uncharacterized protein BCR37DRAFT_377175 [Protomyces lactucae-debilis]ORY85500.1 hypothetical protein BCR37DRAFT_377175 [Protomyces lactucae-debilis]